MNCDFHGTPLRKSGMLFFCDLCRDCVPALPPSNGKPMMTTIEALHVLRKLAAGSAAGEAAYNTVAIELRTLTAVNERLRSKP